ncbi:MAG: hypothetical protein B6242_15910 [Anaerolineaceae bacterium 4572_78]|nr:MAG: hypothetical protein B6242_15910 [Anaerolineaceae bacterium 4572_78]
MVKTPAFGILFVETDKGLLTETEQLLINLLSIQIGYMLDYLYRFDTVIPQKEILKIDSVGRHVWLEGKSVHLSPNELTLLKLLYDYQDKTCSRAFIRQTVYPDEFTDDTLPNFSGMRRKIHYREDRLDVLVSKLRRKLKLLSDDTIKIETVWGKGYWLKIEADSAKIK